MTLKYSRKIMCEGHNLPERMRRIHDCIRALHCPTRWDIIDCIGTGQKSSKEIFEELGLGEAGMTFAGLYYHLSALKGAGIIEVASFRETKGAIPEKVWRLKTKQIVIDLLKEDEVK